MLSSTGFATSSSSSRALTALGALMAALFVLTSTACQIPCIEGLQACSDVTDPTIENRGDGEEGEGEEGEGEEGEGEEGEGDEGEGEGEPCGDDEIPCAEECCVVLEEAIPSEVRPMRQWQLGRDDSHLVLMGNSAWSGLGNMTQVERKAGSWSSQTDWSVHVNGYSLGVTGGDCGANGCFLAYASDDDENHQVYVGANDGAGWVAGNSFFTGFPVDLSVAPDGTPYAVAMRYDENNYEFSIAIRDELSTSSADVPTDGNEGDLRLGFFASGDAVLVSYDRVLESLVVRDGDPYALSAQRTFLADSDYSPYGGLQMVVAADDTVHLLYCRNNNALVAHAWSDDDGTHAEVVSGARCGNDIDAEDRRAIVVTDDGDVHVSSFNDVSECLELRTFTAGTWSMRELGCGQLGHQQAMILDVDRRPVLLASRYDSQVVAFKW